MGGVAVAVWLVNVGEETLVVDTRLVESAESEAGADVLVVLDEENKGVCVEAVVVQGLEAEKGD